MTTPTIKACLFDMDGLLINTEDMYTKASNSVLADFNKGPLPWSVKIQLQGLPGTRAAAKLLEWAQIDLTPQELFDRTSKYQEQLWPETQFLPGALELLQHLEKNNIPFALATSSLFEKYLLKTSKLRHGFDLFRHHVVTGDDQRVPPGKGKPAPDIWHVALESLNAELREKNLPEVTLEETLVFEDGIPGVKGAYAAGCPVVWVPHPEAVKLLGAEKMNAVISEGRGEILSSLEDFKPEKYGI